MDATTLARLFEAPVDEFVSARNALARELREAGKNDEAKEVASLRKPSKALWLVNQLARRAPKELQSLIDSTRRIREAQENSLAGDVLREAMREQREALAALSAAAGDAALDRRLRDTLQAAAAADPDALREGRLTEELRPSGFDALLASGVAPAEKPRPSESSKRRERAVAAAEKEAKKLSARAGELAKAASRAQAEADRTRKIADHAQAAADKAAEKARDARTRADQARAHADELR